MSRRVWWTTHADCPRDSATRSWSSGPVAVTRSAQRDGDRVVPVELVREVTPPRDRVELGEGRVAVPVLNDAEQHAQGPLGTRGDPRPLIVTLLQLGHVLPRSGRCNGLQHVRAAVASDPLREGPVRNRFLHGTTSVGGDSWASISRHHFAEGKFNLSMT